MKTLKFETFQTLCAVRSRAPLPPFPMVSPQIQGLAASRPGGLPLQACRTPYRTPLGPHTKEWNGGLAGEHERRENAIHTQTRGVCVCVSQSTRENHLVRQEGGWEIEWPYIHKDMVCVCVCLHWQKRKPSCSTEKGGGFSFLPGPHAQLENHKTAGGISCSTGAAGRIHHDVHYLLKYKST